MFSNDAYYYYEGLIVSPMFSNNAYYYYQGLLYQQCFPIY